MDKVVQIYLHLYDLLRKKKIMSAFGYIQNPQNKKLALIF